MENQNKHSVLSSAEDRPSGSSLPSTCRQSGNTSSHPLQSFLPKIMLQHVIDLKAARCGMCAAVFGGIISMTLGKTKCHEVLEQCANCTWLVNLFEMIYELLGRQKLNVQSWLIVTSAVEIFSSCFVRKQRNITFVSHEKHGWTKTARRKVESASDRQAASVA